MNVLFVCTGNTCRSPMAAALLQKAARDRGKKTVRADCAGLAADGSPASEQAVAVMHDRGIDLSGYVSKPVTATLCEQADVIVPMTAAHAAVLTARFGVSPKKLYSHEPVADPYGGTAEEYEHTAQQLEQLVQRLLDEKE